MSGHEVEAVGAVNFAPFAEAIGIRTVDIMGAIKIPGHEAVVVVFTRDEDPTLESSIWSVSVAPDADGILRMLWEPLERGTLEEVVREYGF